MDTCQDRHTRHFIKLTKGQYTALKEMTGGSPEYQTEVTRSLVTQIGRAQYSSRSQAYHACFTTPELRAASFALQTYALWHTSRYFYRLMQDYGHLLGAPGA